MKEFLYAKTGMIASINVGAALVSLVMSNPLGFLAGCLAVIAGIINISIQYHKWKNGKEGWIYFVFSKLFKWKK